MSLRLLTIFLVVLVLVPAAILAWLGWQGASAWDAAFQARIDAEVRGGAAVLRETTRHEATQLEAAVRARLASLAVAARLELPTDGVGPGMVRAARRLEALEAEDPPPFVHEPGLTYASFPTLYDLRLVDGEGRTIWPVPFQPDDPASERPMDRLAFDLRREADRLRHGEGGLPAARAHWQDVVRRAPTACLRAWARAEAALLPAEAGPHDPGTRLAELEDTLSPVEERCAARPLGLLLLAAASLRDPAQRNELRRRWRAGWVASAPLTDEERRHGADLVRHPRTEGVTAPPAALLPAPDGVATVRVGHDVGRGARLEARATVRDCWNATAYRVMRSSWGNLDGFASPWVPDDAGALPSKLATTRVPGAFGVEGTILFYHREQSAFDRARRLRRTLTFGGVIALLALMLVGLFLVRRAVVRERSASRLRDDFVANVSHELRTPLASVLLHADLLGEPGVSEARREHLTRVVHAEGVRLRSLIEDLLDFEALASGKRTLEPEPIDLRAAVKAAVLPYETLAEQDGVELHVYVPDRAVAVFADPHAVGRILANLLSNAWRHGRPSRDGAPGRIEVALAEGLSLDAVVEVADDGKGVPSTERDAVFERFRRGSASEGVRGTGLGLALARDLARAMEGDLTLGASEARTVFRLRLPLELDAAEGAT